MQVGAYRGSCGWLDNGQILRGDIDMAMLDWDGECRGTFEFCHFLYYVIFEYPASDEHRQRRAAGYSKGQAVFLVSFVPS